MHKTRQRLAILLIVFGSAQVALASDAELCLDCHEPAEDWQGMTAEEIFAEAKNSDIKRHADNMELADETLHEMIAELLAE